MHGLAGDATSAAAKRGDAAYAAYAEQAGIAAWGRRRWVQRLLVALLVALGWFLIQVVISADAAQAYPDATSELNCWDPHSNDAGICGAGSPDVRVSDPITLYALIDTCDDFWSCVGLIGENQIGSSPYRIEWDLNYQDGTSIDIVQNGVTINSNQNNQGFQTTTSYSSTGVKRPRVRACGSAGCTSWAAYSVVVEIDLDVGANQAPSGDMQWWSPCYETFGACTGGSPDGRPTTQFTFTLNGISDPEGDPIAVEWDLDDNGSVDKRTPSSGYTSSSSIQDTWTYNAEVVVEPRGRVIDDHGGVGSWEKKYDLILCAGNCDLDTEITPPDADLDFSPRNDYSIPAKDGTPFDTFTFDASGSADGDPDLGGTIVQYRWDFNGDGTVDQTTASATTTTTYNGNGFGEGAFPAKVTVVDNDGATDTTQAKDITGLINIDVDVVDNDPDVDMQAWSPCYQILGVCAGGSPDGRPGTTFTFTASGSDDIGIVEYQWDFDGNCPDESGSPWPVPDGHACIDQVTAGNTTTHVYGSEVVVEPMVRAKDGSGQYSVHSPLIGDDTFGDRWDILGVDIDLDAVVSAPEATMQCWDPHAGLIGIDCGVGVPDGSTFTTFTLTADFEDPDAGLGGQVVSVQWDFDGNGTVDQTNAVTPAGSGTVTTTHQYAANGAYEPQVRFVDNDGATSSWDKWDIAFVNIDLDVQDPWVDVDMNWWTPCYQLLGVCAGGAPDVRVNSAVTLSADVDECGDPTGITCPLGYEQLPIDLDGGYTVEWELNGPGSPANAQDSTTGTGTKSHLFGSGYSTAGAYQPSVRICNAGGSSCTSYDVNDVLGFSVDLDAAAPETTMQWWSPCFEILGICSPGSPDGAASDTFTFTADYADPGGVAVASLQWDLDGNGTVDATTAVSGTSGTGTTASTLPIGVYEPQVRAVGSDGSTGAWDKLDSLLCLPDSECDLDVGDDPPEVDMQAWSPCYQILGLCAGGSPDGRPSTVFTFTANGSDDIGIAEYQWDFDGNCPDESGSPWPVPDGDPCIDAVTAGNTTTHTYGVEVVVEPMVRVKDTSGQYSDHSPLIGDATFGDSWDILGVDIDLDAVVSAPEATMQCWDPHAGLIGIDCGVGSPDGSTFTTFTLTADFEDADAGLGGQVVSVDWDFDGNGTVDQTNAVPPAGSGTVTTTHQYPANGAYEPQVRFTDNDGGVSDWDKWDILFVNIDLDVADPWVDVDMNWWSPCYEILGICSGGTPDVRAGAQLTLNADVDECGDPTGITCPLGYEQLPIDLDGGYTVQWELNGPGSPASVQDSTAGTGTKSHVFSTGYSTAGAYQPSVRICDAAGSNCTSYDVNDVLGFSVDLDAGGPEASMQWWSPCYEILGLCSGGSPDGRPGTTFTFTADYDDAFGVDVAALDWDYEGDGSPDATTAASGTSGTGSHVAPPLPIGVYEPQVRAVGSDGIYGAWDKLDNLLCVPDFECDLDVGDNPPTVDMDWWNPCFEDPLGLLGCIGGSPDGRPSTTFTFTANASDDVGVAEYQWDFDGTCPDENGSPWPVPDGDPCIDAVTAGNTATYTYAVEGVFTPRVRVKDTSGQYSEHRDIPLIGDLKFGDALATVDCLGFCDMDVAITPPDAEVTFTPQTVGFGPDGDASTNFFFDASASTDGDDYLGGAIVEYRWDFNADGTIDRTTATSTTNMTYSDPFTGFPSGFGPGEYDATVTVVDNDAASDTDQVTDFLTGLIPVSVDVEAACSGDADGDGVPCDFDPNDNEYYRENLKSVTGSNVILANLGADAATAMPLGLYDKSFFGIPYFGDQFVFTNPDVVPNTNVRDLMFSLWGSTNIGSGPEAGYVRGLGFCLKHNPSSMFNYDFGFCNYEAAFMEDNAFFGLEDTFKIRATFSGKTISYEGWTTPLVSGDINVTVQ